LGPSSGLYSRFVIITAPLIGVLYIAWLVYGPSGARWLVHTGLLAIFCSTLPANIEYGLRYGRRTRNAQLRVELALKGGSPVSQLRQRHLTAIYPESKVTSECLEMLRAARMGPFEEFDGRVAVAPEAAAVVR
jgi:hypothetical protein